MGGMKDALLKSGLATNDQLKKVEKDKADKARRTEERRRAKEVERRERIQGARMPDFIREAIEKNKTEVELYIQRAEKEMGQFNWRIRGKLKRLNAFDAFILLGSTLVLFGMRRDVADLKTDADRDKNFQEARDLALKPLWAALDKHFPPDNKREKP